MPKKKAAVASKSNELKSYWETLKTPEGKYYYFCEATGVTQYEFPSSPCFLLPIGWQPVYHAPDREVYFLQEASGKTDWDLPVGYVGLPEPEDIVNDLGVYWETLLDKDGEKYFFQEKTNKTQYSTPVISVASRTSSVVRAKLPVMLPSGWYAAVASSGEVYFVKDAPPAPQETDWNLPKGSCTVATMNRGGGGGRSTAEAFSPRTGFTVRDPVESRASGGSSRKERALAVARKALKAWLQAKRSGVAHPIPHRPRLFLSKTDGKVMLINPQGEEGIVIKVGSDPSFEALGVLRGRDARVYAFPAPTKPPSSPSAPQPSFWNATKDAKSGKLYFFNTDPYATEKGPVWVLPVGGSVVARVLLEGEELSVRAKKVSSAKAELKNLREEKMGWGSGGGAGSIPNNKGGGPAASAATSVQLQQQQGVTRKENTVAGAAAGTGIEPPPVALSGMVEVSTSDGEKFKTLYVILDPPSRLLLFFDSPNATPGEERAVVDMLSALVFAAPPPGAPHVANAHCCWVAGEGGNGVFGVGKGGSPSPPSALVFARKSQQEEWYRELTRACQATGMSGSVDPPGRTLLHCHAQAGLFSSLRSPTERWVELNPGEQTLVVHESADSLAVARVLKLGADDVKIGFSCEERGMVRGWGNFRIEVTAMSSYDSKYELHYFRARNYGDFVRCVRRSARDGMDFHTTLYVPCIGTPHKQQLNDRHTFLPHVTSFFLIPKLRRSQVGLRTSRAVDWQTH